MFTRERHRRGTVYFGPYANAKKVRETLDVLNRVFQFRPCEGPTPGRHSGIPCLDFHIERCAAPCIGAISVRRTGRSIDGVIEFLVRDTKTITGSSATAMRRRRPRSGSRMRHASATGCARSRASPSARRRTSGQWERRRDRARAEGDRAAVQLFPLRDGKLVDRHAFHLENVEGQDRLTVLESFCLEYYSAAPAVPPQVIVPPDLTDTEGLEAFLSDLREGPVEVRAPARGEKLRLAELAGRTPSWRSFTTPVGRRSAGVGGSRRSSSSREALNLESLPIRIECFDISNIQGREIVASMSVFVDGQPRTSPIAASPCAV